MQAINLPLASAIVAPAVNLPDQKGVINETVRFVLPVDTLTVVGPGSVVVCTLDLANGSSLPAWLRFNPDTTTVFADPGTADAGVYRLRLTVADGHGGAISTEFSLTIFSDPTLIDTGAPNGDVVPSGGGDTILQTLVDTLWPCGPKLTRPGSHGGCGSGGSLSLRGFNRTLDIFNGGKGYDTLRATQGNDVLLLEDLYAPGGKGLARIVGVERIEMGDGDDIIDLRSVRLLYGDVTIDGGNGRDYLWSNAGNDRLDGGAGDDELDGGAGNDINSGGSGNDLITGRGDGNDVDLGGDGDDRVVDKLGNNAIDGGTGQDKLEDGDGSSFIAGGQGNDLIVSGKGSDVIAYNKGDGTDTVVGAYEREARDVLSLGGGLKAKDMLLSRSGDNLVVGFAGASKTDKLVLQDWYDGNRSIRVVQLIAPSAQGVVVESFDFAKVVNAYDQSQRSSRYWSSNPWSVASAVTQFRLDASTDKALGGELACAYTQHGSLSGSSAQAALDTLGNAAFGRDAQSVAASTVALAGPPSASRL